MADCWYLAEKVIPHARRVMLYGPPGTGKTRAGIFNRPDGQPVYVNTLTDDMPVAELRGHYIRQGEGTIWQDGPAIRAWKEGGRYVLNEIDRASPEVLTFLYALLDDEESAILHLPTGEEVRPAPSFTCVATTNGVPEDLPEALADRFPISLHINEIHPKAVEKLPARWHTMVRRLANIDGPRRVSIRKWMEYHKLTEEAGLALELAGPAVFTPEQWSEINTALLALNVQESGQGIPMPEDDLQAALEQGKDALEIFNVPTTEAMSSTAPNCPLCTQPMVLRTQRATGRKFWGCKTYPVCNGTRNLENGGR